MLKVIGAGFGRTGTHSQKAALELLGFGPCYHMMQVFQSTGHVEEWLRAARGQDVDWNSLFADYQSATDWPSATYWDRQLEAFPDAKVLLSERDPESWYESVASTVSNLTSENPRLVSSDELDSNAPGRRAGLLAGVAMLDEVIWKGTFGGRFADRAHAIDVFNKHNADVKRRTPPDKLLVFDVKQGWEPLCAFLGVPVPDVPFPHVSDRASMRERLTRRGVL